MTAHDPTLQLPRWDAGAEAAARTFRQHAQRGEPRPWLAPPAEQSARREALLAHLAERTRGRVRADLLLSAAELSDQRDAQAQAHAQQTAALDADPNHILAIRAIRRAALQQRDWARAADLLTREAALTHPMLRAGLWTLLAELHLHRLHDVTQAQAALQEARNQRTIPLTAHLLAAETGLRQHDAEGARDALGAAAAALPVGTLAAMLYTEAGRQAERTSQHAGAQALYRHALAASPNAPADTLLGAARTARATGDHDAWLTSLTKLRAEIRGPLGEALASSVAMDLSLEQANLAVGWLEGSDGPTANHLRWTLLHTSPTDTSEPDTARAGTTRSNTEGAVADPPATSAASAALATLLESESAELGMLIAMELAERWLMVGDGQRGAEHLETAARSQRTRHTTQWIMARQNAPGVAALVPFLARLLSADEITCGSAWLLRDASVQGIEPLLLGHTDALTEREATGTIGVGSATLRTLQIDTAAWRGDGVRVERGLRAAAARARTEARIGPLFAWLDYIAGGEASADALEILDDARSTIAGHPLVLRHRMRLTDDPALLADLWTEEARYTSGGRAAYALTCAGRERERMGVDPTTLYLAAVEASPEYLAAAWSLEIIGRANGDRGALEQVDQTLASHATDPIDRSARCLRLACRAAEDDATAAAAALEGTLPELPPDPLAHWLLAGWHQDPHRRAFHYAALAEAASQEPSSRALADTWWLRCLFAMERAQDGTTALGYLARLTTTDHETESPRSLARHVRAARERVEQLAPQQAALGDRILAEVDQASDVWTRVAALERLMRFERDVTRDETSARLSLAAILECMPSHVPTLRALERHFGERGRESDAAIVAGHMAAHLDAPSDAAAYLRLAVRLTERAGAHPDGLLLEHTELARHDLWLACMLEAAARRAQDNSKLLGALLAQHNLLADGAERASAAVRIADILSAQHDANDEVARWLERATQELPDHPTAAEDLGTLQEKRQYMREAACAYEMAARASHVPARALRLWYQAGVLWADSLEDTAMARGALRQAARIDVKHRDVFARLDALYEAEGDTAGRIELLTQRLQSGGDARSLAPLHLQLAELQRQTGDRTGPRQHLAAAADLTPHDATPIRRLADMLWEDARWQEAAEALIRWTRTAQTPAEAREPFLRLGILYTEHAPDARRAEIALSRVCQQSPDDSEAITRLAALYVSQGAFEKAAHAYARCVELASSPEAGTVARLALASVQNEQGRTEAARHTLEQARAAAPHDIRPIEALAALLLQLDLDPALAVHWDRAIFDLSQACASSPAHVEHWEHLAACWQARGRSDAAACCAAAARAVGHTSPELLVHLAEDALLAPYASAVYREDVGALLAPPLLATTTRTCLSQLESVLEKAIPTGTPEHWNARRLRDPFTEHRRTVETIRQTLDAHECVVHVTTQRARVCVPLSGRVPTLVISQDLVDRTNPAEQCALLWFGFALAQAGLGLCLRHSAEEWERLVEALRTEIAGEKRPPHAAERPSQLQAETNKRVSKALSRKQRTQLAAPVMEMLGTPGFSAERLRADVLCYGARLALLATGDVSGTLGMLAQLLGEEWRGTLEQRMALVNRHEVIRDLFAFATSRPWIEARILAADGTE